MGGDQGGGSRISKGKGRSKSVQDGALELLLIRGEAWPSRGEAWPSRGEAWPSRGEAWPS